MTSRAELRRVNRSGVDWHFIAQGKPQQNPRAAMTPFGPLPRTRPPKEPRHGRSTLRIIRLLEQTIAAALVNIDAGGRRFAQLDHSER
jgi:hypothetical protein